MTVNDHEGSHTPTPGSPPDLTGSKSSKSSSFYSSYQSDDNGIYAQSGHFEDIGLDDEAPTGTETGVYAAVKASSNPHDLTSTSDLRATDRQRKRVPTPSPHRNRSQRDLTVAKGRSQFPTSKGQVTGGAAGDGLGLMPLHNGAPLSRRGLMSPSAPSLPMARRNRSRSPRTMNQNLPVSPYNNINNINNASPTPLHTRRGSWQSTTQRKSTQELEKECDEDDGDDVPDECLLENIPISPRPQTERTLSMPPSTATSPERPPKEKIKPVGNGTSPRPAEQGELRSPRTGLHRVASIGQFPINHDTFPKARAKSWTAALSDLSEEAKALTEALEAHADDEEKKDDPRQRRSFGTGARVPAKGPRIRSAIAELPPLRRTDFMIDPLPISKEKEAVLSRTRPSWLPPKDPAEEKRHLKEYQRMMASSLEAERKREAEKKSKTTCRDDTAGTLLRIWEEHVLPNWDQVTRERRTRELWWRGIAPRSRAAVWTKAIGNELGLSDASYTTALRRAKALETTIARGSQLSADEERKKGWLTEIESDVKDTYPELKIFQPGGPLHGSLLDVLKAYAMYRSDVGYIHGTSTIAAMLLINLPTPSAAFQALSNILNRPLPLAFHTGDSGATFRTYCLFLSTLEHKEPRLHTLLTNPETGPEPDFYLRNMFSSLFTDCLSLDQATRLWDVMVFEGDIVLVRAAVAFFTAIEGKLLGATSSKEVCDIVGAGLQIGEEDWVRALRTAGKS